MAIVLHHSRATGSAKLVLIGIANHDGDGGAWPSVKTLAKYASCSESQVQRNITKLEELGEVRRYVQAGGDGSFAPHERPNRYSVLLKCPHNCDRTSRHRVPSDSAVEMDIEPADAAAVTSADPVAPMRPGRTHATPPGRTHATQTVPLTNQSPIKTNASNRARTFRSVWSAERCPANYKTWTHESGTTPRCKHCHENPVARVDAETGEIA